DQQHGLAKVCIVVSAQRRESDARPSFDLTPVQDLPTVVMYFLFILEMIEPMKMHSRNWETEGMVLEFLSRNFWKTLMLRTLYKNLM
ncbi:hypothetical protein S83_047279, partial [Arachis hypogaea]